MIPHSMVDHDDYGSIDALRRSVTAISVATMTEFGGIGIENSNCSVYTDYVEKAGSLRT